jgi:phosphoribosylglycinamide formyltransferase-1
VRGNKLRIAALISGGGTTMHRVIQACSSGVLPYAEIVCVVASKPEAGGINKALAEGIASSDILVHRPKAYESQDQFGEALLREFQLRGVDFVAQLGWLPLTPSVVVEAYRNMMSNQHPGPLRPDHRDFGGKGMYGRRVHAARLNFVRATNRNFWTEAVCQRVADAFDAGPVIKMRRIEVLPGDDTTALQDRVLPVEHEVQIEALDDVSQNRATELTFNDDLVLDGEESILQQAKDTAIQEWPKG